MRTIPPYAIILDPQLRAIELSGELDLAALPTLESLAATAPDAAIIDLAAVTFLDATTLGFLVLIDNRLKASGAALKVVGTPTRLRRLFVITKLVGLLADHPLEMSAERAPGT